MKNKIWFCLVMIGLSILYSCSKDNKDSGKLPEIISSASVTDITATTATFGGEVVSGKSIVSTGVCWSINPNPTISDNKQIMGLI